MDQAWGLRATRHEADLEGEIKERGSIVLRTNQRARPEVTQHAEAGAHRRHHGARRTNGSVKGSDAGHGPRGRVTVYNVYKRRHQRQVSTTSTSEDIEDKRLQCLQPEALKTETGEEDLLVFKPAPFPR